MRLLKLKSSQKTDRLVSLTLPFKSLKAVKLSFINEYKAKRLFKLSILISILLGLKELQNRKIASFSFVSLFQQKMLQ